MSGRGRIRMILPLRNSCCSMTRSSAPPRGRWNLGLPYTCVSEWPGLSCHSRVAAAKDEVAAEVGCQAADVDNLLTSLDDPDFYRGRNSIPEKPAADDEAEGDPPAEASQACKAKAKAKNATGKAKPRPKAKAKSKFAKDSPESM